MRVSPGDVRTNDVSRVLPTEQTSVYCIRRVCISYIVIVIRGFNRPCNLIVTRDRTADGLIRGQ